MMRVVAVINQEDVEASGDSEEVSKGRATAAMMQR